MVVLMVNETSEGSAFGNFEQHRISVSAGMERSSITGSPSKKLGIPTGMFRLCSASQSFSRADPPAPTAQVVHLKPRSVANSIMSTST